LSPESVSPTRFPTLPRCTSPIRAIHSSAVFPVYASSKSGRGPTSLPSNPGRQALRANTTKTRRAVGISASSAYFTAYLRDIENYGYYSFNVVPRSGAYGTTYYLGYSTGYADSRGVEVTLSAQRHQLFDLITMTTQASYAYTYIKASGFAGLDKNMQTSFSTANGDSARLSGNLPFGTYSTTRCRTMWSAAPAR